MNTVHTSLLNFEVVKFRKEMANLI